MSSVWISPLEEIYTANDLGFIRAVAKSVVDSGRGGEIAGYECSLRLQSEISQ